MFLSLPPLFPPGFPTSLLAVVRLFNTILTSSSQAEEESAERKTLAAPQPVADPKKHKGKDNILGRGGRDRATGGVTKEGFEALLKGGGA
jgi:hypothetical protein